MSGFQMSVRQCEAPEEAEDGGNGPADANKLATTPTGSLVNSYKGYEGLKNSPDSKGSEGSESGEYNYVNQYLEQALQNEHLQKQPRLPITVLQQVLQNQQDAPRSQGNSNPHNRRASCPSLSNLTAPQTSSNQSSGIQSMTSSRIAQSLLTSRPRDGRDSNQTTTPPHEPQQTAQQPGSYVEIFTSLLSQALNQQSNVLRNLNQFRDRPQDQQQLSTDRSTTFPIIDQQTTKSFKDLCLQLLYQLEYMEQHMIQLGAEQQLLVDAYQQQIRELYESQLQEQGIQEQIWEAQAKEAELSHRKQIETLNAMHNKKIQSYEELIGAERKKHYECLKEVEMLKAKLRENENCQNCQHKEEQFNQLQSQYEELEQIKSNQIEIINDYQSKFDLMIEENGLLQGKLSKEESNSELLKQRIEKLLDAGKSKVEKASETQIALDNMKKMYELQQKEALRDRQESENLKIQIQEGIKENLQLEMKRKEENELNQIKANDLNSQLAQIQQKMSKQNIDAQEQWNEEEQQIKNEHKKCIQQLNQQLQDYDQHIQKAQNGNDLLIEENKTLQELTNQNEQEVKALKKRVKELQTNNEIIDHSEAVLKNDIEQLKIQNKEKDELIKSFQDEIDHLEGFDIHIMMTKDRSGYQPTNQRQNLMQVIGGQGNQKKVLMRSKSPSHAGAETFSGPSLLDLTGGFSAQYQGVHSLAQAVGQAKIIDKFVNEDKQNKKEIKMLKQKLQEIEKDFTAVAQRTEAINEEKSSLEKLILEILSFGEQCDKQFDQLQEHVSKFENQTKTDADNSSKLCQKIRSTLSEFIKNSILDIEDSSLRDILLGIQAKMNQKPQASNKITLDEALSDILNGFVFKLRQSQEQLKELNKQLLIFQNRDNNIRELEVQKDLIENQLNEQQQITSKFDEILKELNIAIQHIIRNIRDSENELNKSAQSYTISKSDQLDFPLKSKNDGANFNTVEIVDFLFQELRYIGDWTQEQPIQIKNLLKDRERTVQLNLQLNEVKKENSLLQIENDKQKNINDKFRQSIKLEQHNRSRVSGSSMSPLAKQATRPTMRYLDEQNDYEDEVRWSTREKSSDQKQLNSHRGKVLRKESESGPHNQEVLHNLLNRVTSLRDESDPKRIFNQFDGQRISKEFCDQKQIIAPNNCFTDETMQILNDSVQDQMDRPVGTMTQQSQASSYYDHRGSFDLVNQSKVEKISQKYQQQSQHALDLSSQINTQSIDNVMKNTIVYDSQENGKNFDSIDNDTNQEQRTLTPMILSSDDYATTNHQTALQSIQEDYLQRHYKSGSMQSADPGADTQKTSQFRPVTFGQNQRERMSSQDNKTPRLPAKTSSSPSRAKVDRGSNSQHSLKSHGSSGGNVNMNYCSQFSVDLPLQQQQKPSNQSQQPSYDTRNQPYDNFQTNYQQPSYNENQKHFGLRPQYLESFASQQAEAVLCNYPDNQPNNHVLPPQQHQERMGAMKLESRRPSQLQLIAEKSSENLIQSSGQQFAEGQSFDTEQYCNLRDYKIQQITELLQNQEYLLQLAGNIERKGHHQGPHEGHQSDLSGFQRNTGSNKGSDNLDMQAYSTSLDAVGSTRSAFAPSAALRASQPSRGHLNEEQTQLPQHIFANAESAPTEQQYPAYTNQSIQHDHAPLARTAPKKPNCLRPKSQLVGPRPLQGRMLTESDTVEMTRRSGMTTKPSARFEPNEMDRIVEEASQQRQHTAQSIYQEEIRNAHGDFVAVPRLPTQAIPYHPTVFPSPHCSKDNQQTAPMTSRLTYRASQGNLSYDFVNHVLQHSVSQHIDAGSSHQTRTNRNSDDFQREPPQSIHVQQQYQYNQWK